MSERLLILGAVLALAAAVPATSSAQDKIKIGLAISKTGQNTPGAAATVVGNYRLWLSEVQANGGIMIKSTGKRVPVELIEYDDRSQSEEVVRLTERLINEDKVDFILSPWGTAFNSAVAPLLSRAGYPHLAVTFTVEDPSRFTKRFPNMFVFTGGSGEYAEGLVEVLSAMRAKGEIGSNIAMVGVSDQFGLELASAGRKAFQKAGFKLVMDKSYPFGSQDLAGIITEASRANPDAFVAMSYPPDTLGLTEQARALKFNPKVFYTAIGTAFPIYRTRFGKNIEGVLGMGGWNPNAPETKAYFERYKKANNGAEPDRFASPTTYASLQILEQAIERAGTDRKAVVKEIGSGTFNTILGARKLENQQLRALYLVAQWQDGEFAAIWPKDMPGSVAYKPNRPAW
jgi:branched-chain amino acid transport system substrate-binding protein